MKRAPVHLVQAADVGQRVEEEVRLDLRLQRPQPTFDLLALCRQPLQLRIAQRARGVLLATQEVQRHGDDGAEEHRLGDGGRMEPTPRRRAGAPPVRPFAQGATQDQDAHGLEQRVEQHHGRQRCDADAIRPTVRQVQHHDDRDDQQRDARSLDRQVGGHMPQRLHQRSPGVRRAAPMEAYRHALDPHHQDQEAGDRHRQPMEPAQPGPPEPPIGGSGRQQAREACRRHGHVRGEPQQADEPSDLPQACCRNATSGKPVTRARVVTGPCA
jgi:hypothetical protein